jgi:hypothetical protein
MLDVSFNLATVAAMLICIVWPGSHIDVDGLNSPTAGPIPGGPNELGSDKYQFKGRRRYILLCH